MPGNHWRERPIDHEHPTTRRRLVRNVMLIVALMVALASCGGSGDGESSADAPPATEPDTPEDEAPAAEPGDGEDTADEPAGDVDTGGDVEPVSFASEVQPVIVNTCARCHTGDGPGTPHVRFDTAADVAADAFAVALNVEAGVMPPWPASSESVEFLHDWSPTSDEVRAIKAWQEAGAPLDVDPETEMVPAAGVVGLDDADLEVTPNATYDGDVGQPDEYRCLVYDPQLDTEAWIEAYEFVPDQTAVVHHAIGYLIPGSLRARAEALDGQDGQGGWSCFGSSGLGVSDIFLGWAPGQSPTEYDEGSGLHMAPGDFIVVQIHYHFDEEAPPDNSSLRLRWAEGDDITEVVVGRYVAPAEIPCGDDEEGPLCDRSAAMRRAIEAYGPEGVQADFILAACGYGVDDFAGMTDGMASSRCDQPVTDFGEIVSVLGHEHEIGKSFRMTLNPDTDDELVLLDIPDWDFEWQFNYYPAETIVLEPGDWVRIECSWDRSLRDPELEPAYVMWADGTDDEMCFSTIVTRELDAGAVGEVSAGFFDDVEPFDQQTQDCVAAQSGGGAPSVDATVDTLFDCADSVEIGVRASTALNALFQGALTAGQAACLAELYSSPAALAEAVRAVTEPDDAALAAAAAALGDCVLMGDLLDSVIPQLELADASMACLNDGGAGAVGEFFVGNVRREGLDIPPIFETCLTADELAFFS